MANMYHSITAAVDSNTLLRWTEHRDREKLAQEAKAILHTSSIRDWLMNEISTFSSTLQLASLDWLATNIEAPSRTTEHLDSGDYWWFVWVLYQRDVLASIDGLSDILHLAQEQPGKFGASAEIVAAAHEWDKTCIETDFEIPNPSSEGDDPIYVLCSVLAFKRLLNIAKSHDLFVVHMQYSYRRA